MSCDYCTNLLYVGTKCKNCGREPAPVQPVAWTERELELIDGMIEVQLDHAKRCDSIANRTMADKQKGWDLERVALLQKIKATPPAAQPAVPDAIHHTDLSETLEYIQGWNDCRAEMLKGMSNA
jgi:hypothetical protein